METLLIVLVVGCALAFVVQVGRGMWSRARTVERHQQALDTLAGLTQRPDASEESAGGATEHQAHVRLIGPGGQSSSVDASALPPPRALPSNASPFRRPSRTFTSATAAEAGASAYYTSPAESGYLPPPEGPNFASPESALLVPSAPPPPEVIDVGAPTSPPRTDATMPGVMPPEPGLMGEPPTMPVPIVRPQVFYFDDLSSRGDDASSSGEKVRWRRRRRRERRPAAEPVAAATFTPPPPPAPPKAAPPPVVRVPEGEKTPAPTGRRTSVAGVVLAAAAIVVALAAIGVTLYGLPGQGSPGGLSAGTSVPTSSREHPTTTSPAPSSSTTSATPPKPAVLVSAAGGTATYQLRSPSASIVVTATAPCWLEVRANSPLGQIVYEGVLYAGQHSKVTGPAWIRVGNPPAVAVKVNGTPMPVPGAELAVPLNLQFTLG